jgi:uncharacterized membrane protein
MDHLRRAGVVALALLISLVLGTGAARGQVGLTISTPFPSVSVQPGASIDFELTVRAAEAVRADLAVDGVPEGWAASLSGGGNEIQSAFVDPATPAVVTLTVGVPDDAAGEPVTLTVSASGGGETATLDVTLNVATEAGGSVTMQADFPSLRGTADQAFTFNLTVANDTPQQLTFSLQATGPTGWDVSVQPSGQERAASVTVDARSDQRLTVDATAPPDATAGVYPVVVEAVSGDQVVSAELAIEITGTVDVELTTPDGRLNTTANAGSPRDFTVLVVNRGTTPLANLQLSGSGPSEWEITFDPATIEAIDPGTEAEAIAHITPSSNAIAGDYVVTLSTTGEGADASIEVRVTVETPPIWGIIGILLIAATLVGLGWVFRRYGRR